MKGQVSMFEGREPLKITKPLRLIELFAGIGAQAKALENLGVHFEHYRICEFDKYAVASYNAVHGTNFSTSDITKIHAKDLGVVDTDKYEYIMTYSFPCQDLSKAGKGKGMAKDSGTRSGLLWEVERILEECKELPQILVMENVPDVIGEKNVKHFAKWIEKLDSLGYKSKWTIMNAKDYGVPQNRERCFMVSWIGDYYYDFPKQEKLKFRLKDMLEKEVDEKYYLKDSVIKYFTEHTKESIEKGNGFRFSPTDGNCVSKAITTKAGYRMHDNSIKLEQVSQISGTYESCGRVYSANGLCPTINTCVGGNREPKIEEPLALDEKRNGQGIIERGVRVRKLTPKECWRLMGFDDESFYRAEKVVSNSQLYKQAGNSIVVNVLMAIFKNLF